MYVVSNNAARRRDGNTLVLTAAWCGDVATTKRIVPDWPRRAAVVRSRLRYARAYDTRIVIMIWYYTPGDVRVQ